MSSQLVVYASIYTEYYGDLFNLYFRPYMFSHWYVNKENCSPTVTNFTAHGYVTGGLYSYSGSTFTYLCPGSWEKSNSVSSPHSGTHYLASKNMENNRCLGDIDVFQVDGSLYINGQLNTYTITPAF